MKQTKPDCRCTWIDLRDLSILPHGWVMIRREGPDLEGFGIKYLGEGFDPLVKVAQLEAVLADIEEYGTEEINAAVAMRQRIAQLEALWIEYLTGACLYSDAFGVEIPEELSGELDIGLPLARKICKALGGE